MEKKKKKRNKENFVLNLLSIATNTYITNLLPSIIALSTLQSTILCDLRGHQIIISIIMYSNFVVVQSPK